MVQGDREIKLAAQHSKEEQERFDRCLVEAYSEPWWRLFIKTVCDRRNMLLTNLVNGDDNQRSEDRIRGRVQELDFFITLDLRAEGLVKEEKRHER